MQQQISLRVNPQTASTRDLLLQKAADEVGVPMGRIQDFRLLKRSIDARQRTVWVNLTLKLYIDEPCGEPEFPSIVYPDVSCQPKVIVVGAGPAGLFAALRLMELHLRPIILERGKDVHARRKDIAQISRAHVILPESNYSFGEGGAGAYSDGKLFTRSTKRGNVEKVLRVLCQHGANPTILADAHPHIGTDRLPQVIEAIRHTILEHGGEVHLQTRVDALLTNSSGEVCGVVANQKEWLGPVILATGHSARDVYRFLHHKQVQQSVKGLAIGVRLEHPAHVIDQIMYHNPKGRGPWLPAAEYRMVEQVEGRGVYSFCMCPGGFVIPAATGPEQVVVNGMSPSGRNGRWSNSGMVVEVRPEDLFNSEMRLPISDVKLETSIDKNSPLRMMLLQEILERECYHQAHGTQNAPSQRMTDYLAGKESADMAPSSYSAGVVSSPLTTWLPPFISRRLQHAFEIWGRKYRGFVTREATLLALETRTSAPVRIERDAECMMSVSNPGLFPCGEGAGYAGGIVSAAIDGERSADALRLWLDQRGKKML